MSLGGSVQQAAESQGATRLSDLREEYEAMVRTALFVAALVLVAGVGPAVVGGATAGQQEDVESLQEESDLRLVVESIDGDEATVLLVVDAPTNGIGSYEISLQTQAPDVATFTDFEVTKEPLLTESAIQDDGERVALEAIMGDNVYEPSDQPTVLAELTLAVHDDSGEATLTVGDALIGDQDDQQYDISTSGTTLDPGGDESDDDSDDGDGDDGDARYPDDPEYEDKETENGTENGNEEGTNETDDGQTDGADDDSEENTDEGGTEDDTDETDGSDGGTDDETEGTDGTSDDADDGTDQPDSEGDDGLPGMTAPMAVIAVLIGLAVAVGRSRD